jgi:hypothetical protein
MPPVGEATLMTLLAFGQGGVSRPIVPSVMARRRWTVKATKTMGLHWTAALSVFGSDEE